MTTVKKALKSLVTLNKRATITDFDGSVKSIDWKFTNRQVETDEVSVSTFCSFTFQGQFYLLGSVKRP